MKKLNVSEADYLASKFRVDVLGCGLADPIRIKAMLLKLNILTVYRPLSENFGGISLRSKSGEERFMLINSNTKRGRQHFTIAHELYHLYYDEDPKPHVCRLGETRDVHEINANLFASSLLMPQEGILQLIPEQELTKKTISLPTIIKLEQFFAVSRSSMLYRLCNIGLLSKQRVEELLQLYSPTESAKHYGYDTSLYEPGNENLIIGDYGVMARELLEREIISEGEYDESINLISYEDE